MTPKAPLKRIIVFALSFFVIALFFFVKNQYSTEAGPRPAALFVPAVTATKTAALQTDANGNGAVNPGDTLRYTVTVTNGGTDAAGVNFSDTIDANTTLVPGSLKVSPIAFDDSYSSLGNVGINVPAASGVLANDLPMNGAPIGATAVNTAGTQGTVALNPDGSFTFTPNAGFEGATTFTYTMSNGSFTAQGTVTINVSGMIWFINNNAAACTTVAAGCGRLGTPFSTLAAFNTANVGGGSNPDDNDNIFIYESATGYSGAVTLRTGQKLIGQDATAALDTIAGVTVPPFSSPALPAMNSANGTVTNITSTVTLGANTTLRGFSINSTTSTGISGGAVTGVTTSETAVATTTGTAVSLSGTGGTIALRSVSSNGAANGISLTNTTGSFTVTGAGGTCSSAANCTGGAILNSTVNGISLTNVANPSFTRMAIQNTARSGIDGQQVTNFTLDNSFIDNVGTGAAGQYEESNVAFNSPTSTGNAVSGTISITNNILTNARRHGIQIENWGVSPNNDPTNTISNLTISNNSLTSSTNSTVSLGTGILILTQGTATTSAHLTTGTINQNVITNFPSSEGILIAGGSGSSSNNISSTLGAAGTPINITNNTISGQPAAGQHTGSNAIRTSMNSNVGVMNFNISCNGNTVAPCTAAGAITNVEGQTVSAFAGGTITGTTTIDKNVSVLNHTIGAGTAGIAVQVDDGPAGLNTSAADYNFNVTNNSVSQYDGFGIRAIVRVSLGKMDLTVQNNKVGSTIQLTNRNAIRVDAGLSAPGDTTLCMNMTGNSNLASGPLTGSGLNAGIGLRKQGTVATVHDFGIVGIGGAPGTVVTNTQVQNFVGNPNNNTANGSGGSVNGVDILSGSNYTACTQTAPFAEEAANQTTDAVGDLRIPSDASQTPSESPHLIGALFNRPADPENASPETQEAVYWTSIKSFVGDASGWAGRTVGRFGALISPTVIAAEKTADQSAPFSGETVSVNGNIPGGFTLPAGKSVTIQFDAQIDANIPANDFSVSNQGTVSGGNFANVLTDDPAVAGAANPTVTTVVQPPTIAKSFAPTSVAVNGVSTLTLTISNANSVSLTGVGVTDNFPANLAIASPPVLTTTGCGAVSVTDPAGGALGAGDTGIKIASATVANGTPCVVTVKVTPAAEGIFSNTTGTVASTNGGTGLTASALLTAVLAPTVTKSFTPTEIALGATSQLSIAVQNNSATSALTGVSFTDTLPAGVTAPNAGPFAQCGGGTLTVAANVITLTGGTIAAGTTCTTTLNVTGATAGVKNNTVTVDTANAGTGYTANASLTVVAPPTIAKGFAPATVLQNNGFSVLTLTITNPNTGAALAGVGVVDNFPTGLEVNTTPAATNSCGGTFAPTAAATSVTLSGGSIPAGGSCAVSVRVTGTASGTLVNTTQNVTSTNGGAGSTATANLTVTNTAVWNGATDSNWNTSTNWTPNVVPNSGNDVSIPLAGVTNSPIISASDVTVGSVTLITPR
ncbi:MAG: cadherin-like domain-containing protein, partial [Acidobacteria bacterium]|nr:cadherin-like domain-containing protein [Acidobacteriota bacterium]